MTVRDEFLLRIQRFIERHHMSRYAFGEAAGRGGAFVYRLEKGSDVLLSTMEAVETWMAVKDRELEATTGNKRGGAP